MQNYRKALVTILPDSLEGNQGVGLSKNCISSLAESHEGYYSWLFKRMHGDLDRPATHIGRFENLQQDFLSLMQKCDVENIHEIEQLSINNKALNSSSHSHYSNYYNDELRDLVAQKDHLFVDRFGYQFETEAAHENVIKLPRKQIDQATDEFYKLAGRASNYLLMGKDFDIRPILKKMAAIPEKTWHLSGREKTYEAHKQTQSLLLIHDEDFRHYNPTYHKLYYKFEKELQPLLDFIAEYHRHNGFIGRILIAKLRAGGKIMPHSDGLYSLIKCNRIHIPLITNSKAIFTIGGEDKVLAAGEMWEINNATLHGVENLSSQDRTHLIIDWIPNETVRGFDKMPPQTKSPATASASMNTEKIGRNDPCPCGSGKKFKQCHGRIH